MAVFLLFFVGIVICVGPYQYRLPVFGRKDIRYGPPAYPRVYPLLIKNKPKHWESPKVQARKKRLAWIGITVLLASLLFCTAIYPRCLYGRYELLCDGTVTVYDAYNRQTAHHRIEDIQSVCFDTDTGYRSTKRYVYMEVTFSDGDRISFRVFDFADNIGSSLQMALQLKEQYGTRVRFKDTEKLWRVVTTQYLNEREEALLYRLFEAD